MRVQKRQQESEHPDGRLIRFGRAYTVYGISLRAAPQFLIHEPDELSFPFFVTSEVVDVIDPRLSRHWVFSAGLPATAEFRSRDPLICFPAMVCDRSFYAALADGIPNAVESWDEARRLIDSEQPDDTLGRISSSVCEAG